MKFEEKFLTNLGIVDFGYTETAEATSFDKFREWLNKNQHGPLTYLAGDRGEKRQSLKLFWPDFESALVFLFSYKETKKKLDAERVSHQLHLASYTLGFDGDDYHQLLKEKLNLIINELKKSYPSLQFKISLDVHPVLERDLALRAGLGWIGKNSMLINRREGSYFIIASLLLDQKLTLEKKTIETDHCGQCTRCIEACPTNAIDGNTRTIIAADCISTYTIEQMKLDADASLKMNLDSGYIFGCDICQDVCPWNKKTLKNLIWSKVSQVFTSKQNFILDYFSRRAPDEIIHELELVSDRQYKKNFANTSYERSGKKGILKNLYFYLHKSRKKL